MQSKKPCLFDGSTEYALALVTGLVLRSDQLETILDTHE